MRIEFVPSSAVPVSVIAHAGAPVSVAVPSASHEMVLPDSVPDAVPATFRLPAHVALNEPLALVAVCSVGFHLKSTHVEGEGITPLDAEAHVPMRALMVAVPLVGPVTVDLCSNPTHPAAASATATTIAKA